MKLLQFENRFTSFLFCFKDLFNTLAQIAKNSNQ